MRRLGTARPGDGSTHIRPGGALVLCTIVWALCAATIVESVWAVGIHGWQFAVLPLAVSAVVWALLWAPRVVVRPDRLEIRNVLITHVVPMAAIEDVRLGSMLRVILPPRAEGAKREVITAWNAPGVGKDRPRDRLARSDIRSRYEERSRHTAPSTWSERLVRDQRASPSHAVVQAWEQHRSADAGDAGEPSRHLNTAVLIVLAISVLLPAARMLA
ncbi:MAG TPA: PH domain-containing protein [Brevibacterium sp.]|nr:PH domain-containing protein [Brevibacterium sp.]